MKCKKCTQMITGYIDDKLSMNKRLEFEKHIQECDLCKSIYENALKTIKIVKIVKDYKLTENFYEKLGKKLDKVDEEKTVQHGFRWRKFMKISAAGFAVVMAFVLTRQIQKNPALFRMEGIKQYSEVEEMKREKVDKKVYPGLLYKSEPAKKKLISGGKRKEERRVSKSAPLPTVVLEKAVASSVAPRAANRKPQTVVNEPATDMMMEAEVPSASLGSGASSVMANNKMAFKNDTLSDEIGASRQVLSGTKSMSLSVKQEKTAAWKSYKSDKFGFSFDYPSDWKIEENHTGGLNLFGAQEPYSGVYLKSNVMKAQFQHSEDLQVDNKE
jgi:hypothetical protein